VNARIVLIVVSILILGLSIAAYMFFFGRGLRERPPPSPPPKKGGAGRAKPPPSTGQAGQGGGAPAPSPGGLETGEVYFESQGESVKALLFVPEDWDGSCVILVHGLRSRKEKWIREGVVDELVKAGFCCLVFDLPLHGERGKLQSLEQLPEVILKGAQNIVDAAKWLKSNGAERVYAIGRSLGSIVLSVALGRGADIEKAELLLASANFTYIHHHSVLAQDEKARSELATWIGTDIVKQIDPLYALPNYKGAAHLHCGKKDPLLPPRSCEYAYNALTSASERKLFWHDTGHRMPKEMFIGEAISFFKGEAPSQTAEEISPIYVLFVLHFDPAMDKKKGYFEMEEPICVNNYITSRDELVWLLDFADSYGVKLTALFNGFYPQLAIRRGELEPLERLARDHEIGTHAHNLCYDQSGDRWFVCSDPDRWFADNKRAVDELLSRVGGENRVMCAMFERGMYELEDDLMAKYGYDIGLGNRPELFLSIFGHIVWNPWRAHCSNDKSRALEWDPTVGFVSIDHRAQIGSTKSHGGVDSRSNTLKRQFLMAFLEWKVHELRGDGGVWSWGVVHHPNFGDRYNDHIEDFFGWLNKYFIGKETPHGNTIAVYATASEVADAFYEWESKHKEQPSFSYVEGQPYPYLCDYARRKLLAATYAGELSLGPNIYAFVFRTKEGKVFVLAWYNGDGEVTVDFEAAGVLRGRVKVTTPLGASSEAQASKVALTEMPVFVEET